MFDIAIIGGGIVGCAAARELSKYNLNILLLEKEAELSFGASKANSGIVHAGFDCEPGTLKARLNVEGNFMFGQLSNELEIPFQRNGSLVLLFEGDDENKLNKLAENGKKNGTSNIEIIDKQKLLALEPNINQNVVKALYAPTGGIVSPFEAALAFAENAHTNGVHFVMNTKVTGIEKSGEYFKVSSSTGIYETKIIINAAGVFSDEINNMYCTKKHTIKPRKGEYMLFDNQTKDLVKRTIFQLPTNLGKGVLVTPTVHGTTIIGPSADDILDKEDTSTNKEILQSVLKRAHLSLSNVPTRELITTFAGLRASDGNEGNHDFIIEESEEGFINAIGIDSPGISASPAIAKYIADIVINKLQPSLNHNFISKREAIKIFNEQTIDEQNKLIAENPAYGKIVCRCETVTEGEIVSAINRAVGAKTVDGIKWRTRAGMGRCQAGFCTSKVVEILSRELNCNYTDITKFGKNSNLLKETLLR